MKKQIIPAPAVQTGIWNSWFLVYNYKKTVKYTLYVKKKQFFAANWR